MFNQLLKFTLVSSALLWLRPRWKGLLALMVFVGLVHVLHGEYLGYVELSDDRSFLVWSYVIKWVALISGMLAYFMLAIKRLGRSAPQPSGRKQARKTRAMDASSAEAVSTTGPDDGFDFLRKKKQLDSEAEKLLHRKG